MLEVIDISFNGRELDWYPEDAYDFNEWVTVNIGEDGAGNYYQFCVCTNISISKLESKKNIFVVEKWHNINNLVSEINSFIKVKLENNVKDDPYEHLSKYWYWEYQGYNS